MKAQVVCLTRAQGCKQWSFEEKVLWNQVISLTEVLLSMLEQAKSHVCTELLPLQPRVMVKENI